eukprot:4202748-Amphidinium_carterae.1
MCGRETSEVREWSHKSSTQVQNRCHTVYSRCKGIPDDTHTQQPSCVQDHQSYCSWDASAFYGLTYSPLCVCVSDHLQQHHHIVSGINADNSKPQQAKRTKQQEMKGVKPPLNPPASMESNEDY